MKVLIPQDVNESGKSYLRSKGYEVVLGSGFDVETIKREIVDADALLARTAPYPAEVIAAGKKLKVIARYGVGTDNIDVKFAESQGVWVTITKGANAVSVAEHTITLMLACAKNIVYLDEQTRQNHFEMRNKVPGIELRGKTLGIVGLGAIGREVADIAHNGLKMEIVGYDAFLPAGLPDYIKVVSSPEEVFKAADVISLHVPSTPETVNMVCERTIGMMKPNAIIVNCARGGIVNEADLYKALKAHRIAGAGLDVFLSEPPEEDNKLFELSNFVCSPHNAALTAEAGAAMSLSCAHAIDDVLSGRKPQFPINNPVK